MCVCFEMCAQELYVECLVGSMLFEFCQLCVGHEAAVTAAPFTFFLFGQMKKTKKAAVC